MTFPETHYIFFGGCNEGYSGSVLGSVEITVPSSNIDSSDYPNIKVALTRTVTATRQRPGNDRRQRGGFFKRIQERPTIQAHSNPHNEQTSSTDTETLTQCYLWHTPDDIQHHPDHDTTRLKFNFMIPVHYKTPPTVETMLGALSYSLTATSTFASGWTKTTSQPIRILRRAIPDYCRTIHHIRNFSDSGIAISLDLTPDESPALDMKTSYTGKLTANRTIMPGNRVSERWHVVIKELRWRIEETVKVLSTSGHGDTQEVKDEGVRQLCNGIQSGNWSVLKYQRKGNVTDGDTIEIPFNISIPRSANVAEEMGISAYTSDTKQSCRPDVYECSARPPTLEKRTALSVNHRLRLDIVAGVDTIDQATGKLVDRKHLWKLFGAAFRLPIYEFASSEEVPDTAFLVNDIPPMYEDEFQPPAYEI